MLVWISVLMFAEKLWVCGLPGTTRNIELSSLFPTSPTAMSMLINLSIMKRVRDNRDESYALATPHPSPPASGQVIHHVWNDGTDFVIKVGDDDLPCHRLLLMAASAVFRSMLSPNTWKEAKQGFVEIEDIDAETVRSMLAYVYGGVVPGETYAALRLMACSDKYDMLHLRAACANVVTINVDNACYVLALAESHGVRELRKRASHFMVHNSADVQRTEDWAEVRKEDTLKDVVKKM